ncbi:MAG: copper-binding protein [Betaproteobacteria bacterium]|nr:copper-binding protein [Betaproteobacteria bacterium]MDH5221305.1 copper-binding protein [Betaproteobacteria bacterium]MDH5349909.1 copper-binding protein [Betaproteobacteria bacterium]
MKRITMALVLALAATGALAQLAEGEIRKVDKDAQKLTIKHGEIKSLDMPPMTMVFRVKNAQMLEAVKAGDKVKFDAQKEGGQYVVTRIERAK